VRRYKSASLFTIVQSATVQPAVVVGYRVDPYSALNRTTVVEANFPPARKMQVGKSAWFGVSGKRCVSRQKADRRPYALPLLPMAAPSRSWPYKAAFPAPGQHSSTGRFSGPHARGVPQRSIAPFTTKLWSYPQPRSSCSSAWPMRAPIAAGCRKSNGVPSRAQFAGRNQPCVHRRHAVGVDARYMVQNVAAAFSARLKWNGWSGSPPCPCSSWRSSRCAVRSCGSAVDRRHRQLSGIASSPSALT